MNRLKRTLAFFAAGVLVGTLAACAAEPAHVPGLAGPAGVTAAASAASFSVTVATVYGDVTIKKRPSRVVALGYGDADALAALGVTPIAMTAWEPFGNRGTGPWADGLMKAAPQLIPSPQMDADYDQIAVVKKLKPDLILETDLHGDRDRYQRLVKIAPVISAPKGTGEFYSPTVEQQTLRVAQAMGLAQQGKQLVDDLKARVAAVPQEHPAFAGKTISVVSKYETKWVGQISPIERLQFFLDLGFRVNPAFVDLANKSGLEDPDSVDLTPKVFPAMDADLVVVDATWTSSGIEAATDAGTAEAVSRFPRFAALPATRAGRSFVFVADPDRPYWEALDRPSVLSMNWLLDTLVPKLAEKLS
jgi:iron complex transport system substrate-binding protein